jgi:hypothetical protein
MTERELTSAIDLCDAQGVLDWRAVGWARAPIFRPNLRGAWPRKKRWAYWAITSPDHVFALTLADVDYAGLAVATLIHPASGEMVERAAITPLGARVHMPDGVREPVDVRWGNMRARTFEAPGETRLEVRARGIEADVLVSHAGHESLNVVVPFDAAGRRFQLTSKHAALPAEGEVRAWGRRIVLRGYACLDYGRGAWPWRTRWQWGSAAGKAGARTIGFNLGGTWTDATGVTENGVFVDGRLHKISDAVSFHFDARGARIEGGGVDLALAEVHRREVNIGAGPLKTRLDWRFGRFSGVLPGPEGEDILVRDLLGWAENHAARW